jgi:hypothetical protein
VVCFNCGEEGHYSPACSKPRRQGGGNPPGRPVAKRAIGVPELVDVRRGKLLEIGDELVSPHLDTEVDLSGSDGLFRIPATIQIGGEVKASLNCSTLLDSGCNLDIISGNLINRLVGEGGILVEKMGPPLDIKLASREATMKASGKMVTLTLSLELGSHDLQISPEVYILEDLGEDLVLGIGTMARCGLLGFMQNSLTGIAEKESIFIENQEKESLFTKISSLKQEELVEPLQNFKVPLGISKKKILI